jgi:hypothetical protein
VTRPVFHQTDLFHPHADPDDHWDLACNYALGLRGDISLQGVMIDYPPWSGDPAICAVAQMNFITGMSVPVVVGTSEPMTSRDDDQPSASSASLGAVNALLDLLKRSSEPVVINIVGSCRDVALAGKREPGLFSEKCAAIYMDAGTGTPNKEKAAMVEYNVGVNAASYAAIFDLPCPVYWMPCFEEVVFTFEDRRVMEWGTYYRFQQEAILPHLSPRVQNYFLYMLERSSDQNWLRYLLKPVDPELLAKQGAIERNMWSTAGLLNVAGYTVTREGKIVSLAGKPTDSIFTFEPIQVSCSEIGVTEWSLDPNSKNRFIFHVLDLEHYQTAMTTALCSLLKEIP